MPDTPSTPIKALQRQLSDKLEVPSASCAVVSPHGQDRLRRVLSIQSHVVHGYVGNRAAVFPLQLLGFEVDVINSVQFCCHTGYPKFTGTKLDGDNLRDLVDGLEMNGVLNHSHLLTGYIGTASFLREVVALRQRMPPGCRYICDPVMGDNGKFYVSEELVDVYRTEVLPHVTVLTPNQFEAELLTQMKIVDMATAAAVCDELHARGPKTVVITTLDINEATRDGQCIGMMVSEEGRPKWLLRAPFITGGPFTGTGDLTSAMVLAWTQFHPHELPLALEKCVGVLQGVIRRTVQTDAARELGGLRVPPELRIIECKRAIESPAIGPRCCLATARVFRGVVFDMDGTLTLPFQIDFARMRQRVGVPPAADIVAFLREKHAGDESALAEAMAIVEEEELLAFRPPRLQPGVRECIERLRKLKVPLAIFTRNAQACVDAFLQHSGLPVDAFSPVLTRDSPLRNKPSPDPVVHCYTAWGVEAASVLVVGDSLDDMSSGRAAGCPTVAILRPNTDSLEEAAQVALQENSMVKASDFAISELAALERFFP